MDKIMFNNKYGLTKAVLEGRKTNTRRLCKNQTNPSVAESRWKVGDVIAVAQSYRDILFELGKQGKTNGILKALYDVESSGAFNKMFVYADLMPYRIKITNVRVERLQDISEEDCLKEGVITYDDIFGKGYMLDEEYNNNYRRQCDI